MDTMYHVFLPMAALVLALSLDSFFVSLGYGASGIHIPRKAALAMAVCGSGVLAVGLLVGNAMGPWASQRLVKWICVPLLCSMGMAKVGGSALKAWIRRHSEKGQLHFRLFDFRCILQIYADPEQADADHSREIAGREAWMLGLALSMDGAAAGVGAGLAGIHWLGAFLLSLAVTMALVRGGAWLGARIGRKCGEMDWIGGLILLAMALAKGLE